MIAGWFGNAWAKIVAVGAIVLAVLAGLAKVYGAGKTAAKAEGQGQQLENVAKRNAVDSGVSARGDAANRDRLRNKFTRG